MVAQVVIFPGINETCVRFAAFFKRLSEKGLMFKGFSISAILYNVSAYAE